MAILVDEADTRRVWPTNHGGLSGRHSNDEKIPVVSIIRTSHPNSSNNNNNNVTNFVAKRKPQYLATIIPTIGSFSLGTVLAWSSPALPDLAEREDLGVLSAKDKSWIASLAVLGALISGPITGFLINKFGRKQTMLCFAFPFLCGWALIILAQNLVMMGAGRFITGFCGGSFTVAVPVYIFETVEDKLRGLLGSAMVLMLVTGILFAFTVAAFTSWFWLSVICSAFPLIFFISMLFLPETPRFLLVQGKTKRATQALKWLRGAVLVEQIEPELSKLRSSVESGKESGGGGRNRNGGAIRQLLRGSALKPTGISLALMFFQQLGGINAVCFYTVDILRAANPHFDANVASIIIGIVQVLFVLFSMFLVDRIGRKIFLVTSNVIMALSLTALGLFFYLKQQVDETDGNGGGSGGGDNDDTQSTSSMAFVPLVSLISFIIAYSAGAGPLPWLVMSEILPPSVKSIASGIVTSFYWLLAFIATKTFDSMIALLGNHGCYWLYAGVCGAGAIFTMIALPETKGKSTEEIQRYFGGDTDDDGDLERKKYTEALVNTDGDTEALSYHDQKPYSVDSNLLQDRFA